MLIESMAPIDQKKIARRNFLRKENKAEMKSEILKTKIGELENTNGKSEIGKYKIGESKNTNGKNRKNR